MTFRQLAKISGLNSDSLLLQDNGNALVQLDRNQKPIESKINLTLKRVGPSRQAANP